MTIASDIRAEYGRIAAVLEEIGPDAPGGAGHWTVGDVAAHLRSQFLARGAVVFAARALVVRGVRLTMVGRPLHEPLNAVYRRKGFRTAVEALRAGPPPLLLADRVAPVSLFEVWLHHDDVRRANDLEPPDEPETLGQVVDFALRYQRKPLTSTPVDRSVPTGELVRWLGGRPSTVPPLEPPLRF